MDKYTKLTQDLKAAAEVASPLADTDDGGTCNFDSAVLYLPRWVAQKTNQAIQAAGLRGWRHSDGYILSVPVPRQGNARTRQAEAMRDYMRDLGYQTGMYYQMD